MAKVSCACGALSVLTATTARPVSRAPHWAGSLMVADASTNTGSVALW